MDHERSWALDGERSLELGPLARHLPEEQQPPCCKTVSPFPSSAGCSGLVPGDAHHIEDGRELHVDVFLDDRFGEVLAEFDGR